MGGAEIRINGRSVALEVAADRWHHALERALGV
jgi:hypothetical protein